MSKFSKMAAARHSHGHWAGNTQEKCSVSDSRNMFHISKSNLLNIWCWKHTDYGSLFKKKKSVIFNAKIESHDRHHEIIKLFGFHRTEDRFWPDFADIKHDYTQEFYRSYLSFTSQCPRTGKFRGVWHQGSTLTIVTKGRPLVKSNVICPADKLSWQPGCPVLNINIQGNFCISQGNGSSDNLPENLV